MKFQVICKKCYNTESHINIYNWILPKIDRNNVLNQIKIYPLISLAD